MSNADIIPSSSFAPLPSDRIAKLAASFLSRQKETTTRAYASSLLSFAAFCGFSHDRTPESKGSAIEQALRRLLTLSHGQANELVHDYKNHLTRGGSSSHTINSRLTAIRAAVTLGREFGIVAWSLDVKGVKQAQNRRDMHGPSLDTVRKLLAHLDAQAASSPRAARDHAIASLLFGLSLRCSEVTGLGLEDIDMEQSTIRFLGKGRVERERSHFPARVHASLRRWLAVRGFALGPLFLSIPTAWARSQTAGARLSPWAVWDNLKRVAKHLGLGLVRPHGLRHSGITTALDATGGDLRRVRKYSRHAKLDTLMIYDDARHDVAAEIADVVDQALTTGGECDGAKD